jgi:predicted transcriptional regulator
MTERLEQAIAALRQLPQPEQDEAAQFLLDFLAQRAHREPLDAETLAAIREGMAQADRGELVSDEEMEAFFARRGA